MLTNKVVPYKDNLRGLFPLCFLILVHVSRWVYEGIKTRRIVIEWLCGKTVCSPQQVEYLGRERLEEVQQLSLEWNKLKKQSNGFDFCKGSEFTGIGLQCKSNRCHFCEGFNAIMINKY